MRNFKHGKRKKGTSDLTYISWQSYVARCFSPNATAYDRYKNFGYLPWKDFKVFLNDMGERPSKEYSLDRIDNTLPYSPDNCRWATKKEQANNRRNNVFITFGNCIMTQPEWAEHLKVAKSSIRAWSSLGVIDALKYIETAKQGK